MERYGNRSGRSGVVAYAIVADAIRVKFVDGRTYTYTPADTGAVHVERMKELAVAGRGLSSYIARHVRGAYASRDG